MDKFTPDFARLPPAVVTGIVAKAQEDGSAMPSNAKAVLLLNAGTQPGNVRWAQTTTSDSKKTAMICGNIRVTMEPLRIKNNFHNGGRERTIVSMHIPECYRLCSIVFAPLRRPLHVNP